MNAGTFLTDPMLAAPDDPRMSAESQWQLSCCQPGTIHSPYVIDDKVRQDICTGVGKSDRIEAASGLSYVCIFWFPHIGTIGNGSGFYITVAAAADPITQADLITLQTAGTALYGDTAGFSDRFYVYSGSLDVVLRAPEATRSGSVWIGSISWAQFQTNPKTVTQLRQRAKEFDLKDSARFSLKSTVLDRNIVDYINRGAGTPESFQAPIWNEVISYAIISPQAFRNITDGASVNYSVDINVRVNYAWVPEFTAPMLTGAGVGNRTQHPPPTETERALNEELNNIIPQYPMIVPDSDVETIKRALQMALKSQKYTLDPLQPLASFWAADHRSRIHIPDNGMRLYTSPVIGGPSPGALNLASFLKWEPGREASVMDLDSLPPDILDKYDEFDELRRQIVEMIEVLKKEDDETRSKIKLLETRTFVKHGESIIQYRYDGDWRAFDYVFSRLSALSAGEDTESYVTIQPSQSRSNSRKNQTIMPKKST